MFNAVNNRITRETVRLSNLSNAVARTQVEISTGRKILQASDDPVASARINTIRQAQSNATTWQTTLARGIALSDQADGVVSTMSERMARARELTVAGASGTLSASDRTTISNELRSIAQELDGLANTKDSSGNALFRSNRALEFRFNENDVFAPVPTRQDVFERGGVSLSQLVTNAADALTANDKVAVGAALAGLDTGVGNTADAAADIGVRGRRMDTLRERQIDQGINLLTERSSLEDTDLSEAIARLNQQTVTLDAARAAFARINQQTLFDLIS